MASPSPADAAAAAHTDGGEDDGTRMRDVGGGGGGAGETAASGGADGAASDHPLTAALPPSTAASSPSVPSPAVSPPSAAVLPSPPAPLPPPPHPSVDAKRLEGLVLSYLRKRGYQWTEEQLRALKASAAATAGQQSGGGGGSVASPSSLSAALEDALGDAAMDLQLSLHSALLHSLLTAHPRVQSPEHFDWTYSQLRSFVLSLVDVYAVELKAVLWPLFLHSFIQLFLLGQPADALTFLGRHKKDHEAQHHSELILLAQIQQEGHIHKSDYTKFALQRKMEITVTEQQPHSTLPPPLSHWRLLIPTVLLPSAVVRLLLRLAVVGHRAAGVGVGLAAAE